MRELLSREQWHRMVGIAVLISAAAAASPRRSSFALVIGPTRYWRTNWERGNTEVQTKCSQSNMGTRSGNTGATGPVHGSPVITCQ